VKRFPNKKKPIGLIRSVGILVTGTVIAHSITALVTPVLSRLYSPADFSLLAVFSGVLSIISVAACLRFDIAIPLPDKDADATNILALALSSAVGVSIMIGIPCLLMPEQISRLLNQMSIQSYLWLLPPGVLLAAIYSLLQNWFVRKKRFGLISTSRIGQSVGAAGTQVGLGFAGAAPLGLIVGHIMNSGAACLVLGCKLARSEGRLWKTISVPRMRAMASSHHRFPKYSTFEALSNSAAIHVPIIIIAAVAAGPDAGHIMMGMYVLQAPVALIGTAIAQVYLSHAPAEHRAGKLDKFTAEILGKLLKVGAGPLFFAAIISPVAFPIVFGEEWRRAGHLVSWMAPWFLMQFIVYPISMALHVTNRQRTAFMLQAFSFFFRISTVSAFGYIAPSIIAEAYAISGFVIYSIYAGIILEAVSIGRTEIIISLREALPFMVAWIVLGSATRIGIHIALGMF
jgi:O-antigen/teichoic acid export membrane protein